MKHFITFVFCLAITALYAQNKGIHLIKKESNEAVFLKENRRIKVKTTDGKAVAGKFAIINDSVISIKNQIIPIDSNVSRRKASTFSAISSPVSIGISAVFLIGSVAAISSGGYAVVLAVVLLPTGLPLFIIPLTANKHPIKKWKYEIVSE